MKPNPEVRGIGEVVAAELAEIADRRACRAGAPPAVCSKPVDVSAAGWERECIRQKLAAVALSGGGMRSATFALGVLQGLTEKGMLQRADYLSTVSGGGYIGSWLQALLAREKSFDQLDPTLTKPAKNRPKIPSPVKITDGRNGQRLMSGGRQVKPALICFPSIRAAIISGGG